MAKPAGKKKQNGYKIPEAFPKGEVLVDNQKNNWRLGVTIGSGGFGLIYSAQKADKNSSAYPFAVKIEPHENGPLFVEMQFYMRNAKEADVDKFVSEKKLPMLGMPVYIASGSHTFNDDKYRFLIMQKFGSDIWKIFLENKKQMPPVTVYKLGIQVLHVLEYIHSMGYIHGDIKGANLLLGENAKDRNQVYLVDFGLACKFSNTKAFKVDAKRAHNGTIEYTSRDAHDGVPTRRGDIEILFYNLIHWFGGVLPWEHIKVVKNVHGSKVESMDDLGKFLNVVFKKIIPVGLLQIGKYILSMEFNDAPNYKKIHDILLNGLKSSGGAVNSPLVFKVSNKRASTSDITPNKKMKSTDIVQNGNERPEPRKRRSMSVDEIIIKTNTRNKRAPKVKISPDSSTNMEVLTAEMMRIKEKLDAKKTKRPTKAGTNASNELVPVPSTSKAKASAGLKKKHIADALPLPKTRLVLENKDPESDEDSVAPKIAKRKPRR